MESTLTCCCRFLKSHDVFIPPEYLHTPARPSISDLDSGHLNTDLHLLDLLVIDQADNCTSPLGLDLNLESSANTIPSEGVEILTNRSHSASSSHFDTTLPQADEGCEKSKCHRKTLTRLASCLHEDPGTAGVAAERQVRRRKSHPRGDYIISEDFSQKQIAQLQDLAAKTVTVQSASTNPPQSPDSTIIAAFAMTIGRLSSLIFLKRLVHGYRTNEISIRDNLDPDPLRMSPASRMIIINNLDRQIAFQGFLRTYHLYKLMSENRYGLQDIECPFQINSFERPVSPAMSKRGNPRHQQRAQLCKSMMKDFFPNLSEDHVEYKKKYREVLSMRRTSFRLNQLVSQFSMGILGLVPLEGSPEDQLIGLLNHS